MKKYTMKSILKNTSGATNKKILKNFTTRNLWIKRYLFGHNPEKSIKTSGQCPDNLKIMSGHYPE
ncbi:hypothetical protein JCM39194_00150 [Desulfotomaculum varum]